MFLFYAILIFTIWSAFGCLVVMVSERIIQQMGHKSYSLVESGSELLYILGAIFWPFWFIYTAVGVCVIISDDRDNAVRLCVKKFFHLLRKKQ